MRKKMIVFGAGTRGEEFIRGTADQVVAIWDNDVTKSGMPLHGVTITTPPKSVNEIAVDYDAIVIAITDWQPERVAMLGAMLEQLKKLAYRFTKLN